MNLSQLLNGIELKSDYDDRLITDITNHSANITDGCVYVAIPGETIDGHQFAHSAVELGAAVVLLERDMGIPKQIIVKDTKKAFAQASANFFSNPSSSMMVVGVTGTNGKTSTTIMVQTILEFSGIKTGLIGTIAISYGDVVRESHHTTPDAYTFQQTLREMQDAGCKCVVVEVSSHALIQQRVYGTEFDICVFTNLSPEHLDYHQSMEEYFKAKSKLFFMGKRFLVNQDHAYGKKLIAILENKCYTFGMSDQHDLSNHPIDFVAQDVVCSLEGVSFRVLCDGISSKVNFAIPGRYSVENALAAIGVCKLLGISMECILTALESIKGIPGRSELIYKNDRFSVIGDYAHTPDGIENVLQSLREVTKGRLIVLFGCGGDRDKTKRPLMAKACERYADCMIITSDNPRNEDPNQIIEEILKGISSNSLYFVQVDRTLAIEEAMNMAKQGDVIVLLGKGHENYQILKSGKIHYDEREVVARLAEKMKKTKNKD